MISSGRPNVSRFGVTKSATPPGSMTLPASATTRSGSGTCSSECTESSEANERSAKGSSRMSATTVSRCWPSSAGGSMSTPTVSRGLEQVVAVADPAAEIEDPPLRSRRSAGTARRADRRRHGAARWD